ncbi:peptide ABC transporter permease protein [Azorhizobium caulinodans ORS 571]|uniref:Peptide ABC transporter permease protein n=1 Tax=Azorhizobium caulinodans (strain ATCC 43989 / DSM 5975 / JCM 20966 / LMG 6465 / NBRC 14845 / NCIMB 13405 / ORS 571) TaxID=438753 RepID=A8IE65_AZOC5|nr:ABC transporter permease [Azorhizobium caulinodans]BAF89040.1 peptide ABC transporter permease protein [Azorhizobium caulinodans ORS 571]
MLAFTLRRTLIAIGLVWLVGSLVFLVIHLIPGDPAELLLSQGGVAPDPGAVAELRERLGLDLPLYTQYLKYWSGLLHGDFGSSLQDEHPVASEIALRLPRTLELIGAAALMALAVGLPLGTAAALKTGGRLDRAASFISGLALSVPVFVVGTLAILVFAQKLGWASAGGYVALAQNPLRHFGLLLMPAGTIAVGLGAVVFRVTRSSVLEVLSRDHVRAAQARGVPAGTIIRRHVLRNALSPVLTVVALHLGSLLGGTVLVEYVFNWPGLSGYLVRSVEARDYPEVLGIVLAISILFVFLNLVVDLLYAALDPRVRHA